MPTVSVIIPVYNAGNHLEQCIESIVNQTYKDIEIILSDSGSTDKSGEICDLWAAQDCRVKVIRNENSGVSDAKNAGLDAASGEYIIFADADSIFSPDSVEKCISEISANCPDLLVCAMEAPADDKRSRIYMDTNMYTRSEYIENIARYIDTGLGFKTVTNKVFRADIIHSHRIHFDADMSLVSDEIFNCRYFMAAGHIRCIAHTLCTHSTDSLLSAKGTTEYLLQGKAYSQILIDAVQSKGLYGAASRAIGENYQKILYKHLVLLSLPNDELNTESRISSIDALSKTGDSTPLMLYLGTLKGIKNRYIYEMYKLRQWRLLLSFIGK